MLDIVIFCIGRMEWKLGSFIMLCHFWELDSGFPELVLGDIMSRSFETNFFNDI